MYAIPATMRPGSSRWMSKEYWWTYADWRNWSMKSTVPPAPVRIPSTLPVGWEMPLGNGFTMLQPAQGVRPPSVLAT